MKTMTCRQLGGACDLQFKAEIFDEIAELSKKHGTEMFKANDAEHLKAMKKMQALMQKPDEMQRWFESKQKEFNALPD